jgi:hypothetical protein
MLRTKIKDSKKEAEYFWILILGVILPAIGFLGGWLIVLLARLKGEDKRYIQHERFEADNFSEIELRSLKIRESLPINMGLQTFDDYRGKELVVQMMETNIPNQGRYLKAAVTKPSPETAHYAATALNMLTKRYDSAIKKVHLQVSETQQIDSYRSLLKLYKDYIDSDLLSDTLLREKKRAYQACLEEAIRIFPEDVLFHEQLMLYLWKEQNNEYAVEIAEKIIQRYSVNENSFFILIQEYLQKGNNARLKEIIEQIENKYGNDSIPYKLKQLLSIIKGDE